MSDFELNKLYPSLIEDKRNINHLYGKFAASRNDHIMEVWAIEWQLEARRRQQKVINMRMAILRNMAEFWPDYQDPIMYAYYPEILIEERSAARASQLARYFMGLEE